MSRAITSFRGVPSGDRRIDAVGKLRRVVVGAVVVGLGGVVTAAAVVIAIMTATAWTMAVFRGADAVMIQASALKTPGPIIVANRSPVADDVVTGSLAPMQTTASLRDPAPVPERSRKADRLPLATSRAAPQETLPDTVAAATRELMQELATPASAFEPAAPPPVMASLAPITPPSPVASPAIAALLPRPRPANAPAGETTGSIAPAPAGMPKLAALTPVPPRRADIDGPDPESRTAVYDIASRTVHMPNGVKLLAHSGLGPHFDNPNSTRIKMRGPTPPNVYRLTLRERPFHGVRAIRLNPVFEDKMYGRDGILAHSYLLGPRGESNGCVSFADYPKFLEAFLRGEVDRMVVVPDLKSETLRTARARGRQAERYASN